MHIVISEIDEQMDVFTSQSQTKHNYEQVDKLLLLLLDYSQSRQMGIQVDRQSTGGTDAQPTLAKRDRLATNDFQLTKHVIYTGREVEYYHTIPKIDRQTYRQVGRQMNKQIDRQIHRCIARQTNGQIDRQVGSQGWITRYIDRQIDRYMEIIKWTCTHIHRSDRQIDRQINRSTT